MKTRNIIICSMLNNNWNVKQNLLEKRTSQGSVIIENPIKKEERTEAFVQTQATICSRLSGTFVQPETTQIRVDCRTREYFWPLCNKVGFCCICLDGDISISNRSISTQNNIIARKKQILPQICSVNIKLVCAHALHMIIHISCFFSVTCVNETEKSCGCKNIQMRVGSENVNIWEILLR